MAYALAESGDAEMRYLNDLFTNRAKLGPYGRALLALGLKERNDNRAQAVAGELERDAKGNGAEAFWQTEHGWNDAEATAVAVKALARVLPTSEVLPRAARWLVGHRRHGYYWLSTRETAFAVYGLLDYVKVSKELDPDYALEVYVDGQQVVQKQVTAADSASMQVFTLQRRGGEVGQSSEVRVVKRGRGARLPLDERDALHERRADGRGRRAAAQAAPRVHAPQGRREVGRHDGLGGGAALGRGALGRHHRLAPHAWRARPRAT